MKNLILLSANGSGTLKWEIYRDRNRRRQLRRECVQGIQTTVWPVWSRESYLWHVVIFYLLTFIYNSTGDCQATVSAIDSSEIRCQQSSKCHPLHGPWRRLQTWSGIFFQNFIAVRQLHIHIIWFQFVKCNFESAEAIIRSKIKAFFIQTNTLSDFLVIDPYIAAIYDVYSWRLEKRKQFFSQIHTYIDIFCVLYVRHSLPLLCIV